MTTPQNAEPEAPAPGINAAMVAIMRDVDHLAKREKNKHYGFTFRGIDAVLNALGPVMRRHGVFLLPNVRSRTYDEVATSKGKPATAVRVQVTYEFVHESGESVETTVYGEAWDEGDKGTAKAMSVALRTAMLQVFALPTDEPDPDQEVYHMDPNAALSPAERPVSAATFEKLTLLFTEYGVEVDAQQAAISSLLQRQINAPADISEAEGLELVAYVTRLLEKRAAEQATEASSIMNDVEPDPQQQ